MVVIGISTIPVGIVTDIVIENPGIGYTDGDYIQIGDDCYYEPILTANGSIIGIKDISPCNIQFTIHLKLKSLQIREVVLMHSQLQNINHNTSLITKMLVSEVSELLSIVLVLEIWSLLVGSMDSHTMDHIMNMKVREWWVQYILIDHIQQFMTPKNRVCLL